MPYAIATPEQTRAKRTAWSVKKSIGGPPWSLRREAPGAAVFYHRARTARRGEQLPRGALRAAAGPRRARGGAPPRPARAADRGGAEESLGEEQEVGGAHRRRAVVELD